MRAEHSEQEYENGSRSDLSFGVTREVYQAWRVMSHLIVKLLP